MIFILFIWTYSFINCIRTRGHRNIVHYLVYYMYFMVTPAVTQVVFIVVVVVSCKWSYGVIGLLQMIIQRDWPLANNQPEGPASYKWSSWGTGLLQIIFRNPRHPIHLCQYPDSISRTQLEQFVLVSSIFASLQFISNSIFVFSTLCFLALAYLHNSPATMKVDQYISESTIFKGKLKLVYESTKMKLDLVLEVAYE